MAARVFRFTATIPAGTPADTPATVDFNLDGYNIEQIDLEVPAGPAGNMGFQLVNNGIPWIPFQSDQWVIWDGIQATYYTTDYPNASGWGIVGYNTGQYDHNIIATFHCVPIASPTVDTATFVTAFIAANIDDAINVIL
jgi:hypothetical protein